ncbi:hypothetical protein DY000_02009633 [Brassica cretica]|uniref:CCHC-type domain-containing protein n=1 Tax=Brassica cretica TaxID=69181 RepID=A0ABQ7BTR9_BRACR|nr:hypothetical protein DY000_02009633 [Brassica cretica]
MLVFMNRMAPRGRRTARGRGAAARLVRGSQLSDQPAGYAEMMAELQRYRERFGDQMREESADGTPRQADARGNVPGVGESKLARNTKPKTAKRAWEAANTASAEKRSGGIICFRCNQHGHTKKDCRFPPNVRCYRCYREDHTSSACPLPPQGAPKAGAPQQGTRRNEQLPPQKKQAVGGRAFVVGDHEGGEPIVEMEDERTNHDHCLPVKLKLSRNCCFSVTNGDDGRSDGEARK